MVLKLYVWEDVLKDWSEGAMWALANSVDEAREEIKKSCSYVPPEDLAQEPKVYDQPIGFTIWGGG